MLVANKHTSSEYHFVLFFAVQSEHRAHPPALVAASEHDQLAAKPAAQKPRLSVHVLAEAPRQRRRRFHVLGARTGVPAESGDNCGRRQRATAAAAIAYSVASSR